MKRADFVEMKKDPIYESFNMRYKNILLMV